MTANMLHSDLRDFQVGNLYKFHGDLTILTHDYLSAVITAPVTYGLINWERIPITRLWLRRMGFVSSEDVHVWNYSETKPNGDKLFPAYILSKKFGMRVHESFYNDFMPVIKYVDQLQNVFHAITNKELTIQI